MNVRIEKYDLGTIYSGCGPPANLMNERMSDMQLENIKIDFSANTESFVDAAHSIVFPEYKTKITIGSDYGIVFYVEKRFNWFQKKMMRWCFGWKVTDID